MVGRMGFACEAQVAGLQHGLLVPPHESGFLGQEGHGTIGLPWLEAEPKATIEVTIIRAVRMFILESVRGGLQ